MKRKNFLHTATTATALPLTESLANPLEHKPNHNFDSFGGWKGKKFQATGFFRVEKSERWWIVTPEGHAFISFGVNHYHDNWWAQIYNKEHFIQMFGAKKYQDESWKKGFNQMARKDLEHYGLNTLGMHTGNNNLNNPPLGPIAPYIRVFEPLNLSHYRHPQAKDFIDIFDPIYEKKCDKRVAKQVEPYANDPYLLGYNMSDCPMLCDADADTMGSTTWARELRILGPKSPGKLQYVKLMRERYSNISDFNMVYNTTFLDWQDLSKSENWRQSHSPVNDREVADNQAFMELCIDKYYSTALKCIRKVDKNHMFFGDKLNADTPSLETVCSITSKYTDIITYQAYKSWEEQEAMLDRIAQKIDHPIMNGDGMFNCVTENQPNPHGFPLPSREERCEKVKNYAEESFARPEFVGWHICGIIDTLKTMPGKEKHQHQGIYSVTREHFPQEENVIQEISNRLYEIALSKT